MLPPLKMYVIMKSNNELEDIPMTKELTVLESIREQMAAIPGHLGFYYQNLATGLEFGVGESEAYLAASVIKLPLFLHVLSLCEEGKASLDQRLIVTAEDKMPSCGALSLFTGDVEVDIRTLCRLMIDLSDNTATNKLINFCTIPGANEGFRSLGLEKTVLRRLLFDSKASAAGLENTICPKEMGTLLEMLYRERFINSEMSRWAIDVLLNQQICHKLEGKLKGEFPVAHKTGEDDRLSNDVGIVFAKEPFVICFAGHDTDVYPWEDLMRRSVWDLCRAQD